MKVTFSRDFDYSPPEFRGTVTVAYKAGQTYTVPRLAAEAALSAEAGMVVGEASELAQKRRRVKS